MLTAGSEPAQSLAAQLEALGAHVELFPLIAIADPVSWSDADQALAALDSFDWIVFTSTNAVRQWVRRAVEVGRRSISPKNKIATVGAATARQLEALGFQVDLVPEKFHASGLLAAWSGDLAGQKFLLPRGDLARPELPEGLRARGALVREVVVYQTRELLDQEAAWVDRLRQGEFDVVTFASPSAVESFVDIAGHGEDVRTRLTAASIGPTTSKALREHGLEVAMEAATSTWEGLKEAIVRYFDHL
ncbi:MAG: uroporphyrinogen-III synthase [Acidobacteriia bacterium]|nr:uroporphyrinogen-III synthase [Terriglobia bacterium]